MIQVLHLLSRSCGPRIAPASGAIRRLNFSGLSIAAHTIGRGGDYSNLVHAAAALRFGRGANFDVVHVWDELAFGAAVAGPLPVVLGAPESGAVAAGWLKTAATYRDIRVVVDTAAARETLCRRGLPRDRCHLAAPAIDLSHFGPPRDPQLRAELGFCGDEYVVLAPGESTLVAHHATALHAISILHVMDGRFRMLIWGRGKCAKPAVTLASKLCQPRLITLAEERLGRAVEPGKLTSVADLALFTGSQNASVQPLACCMAAGLPLVASATRSTLELLEPDRTAIVVPPAPRLLAESVLHLWENPESAVQLGQAARTDAAHRFDAIRLAADYERIYHRAAGLGLHCRRQPGSNPVRDQIVPPAGAIAGE